MGKRTVRHYGHIQNLNEYFLLGNEIIPKHSYFEKDVDNFTKKLGFNDWDDTKAYLSYEYRHYNNTVRISLKTDLSDLDKITFAMRSGMSLHSAIKFVKGATKWLQR